MENLGEFTISPSKVLRDLKDRFQVRVLDHFFTEEGLCYNDHFYRIEVLIEDITYTLDRCILDFVDLDRRARKRYPRCQIDALPLSELALLRLSADLERSERAKAAYNSAQGGMYSDPADHYSPQPMNRESRSSIAGLFEGGFR